MNQTNPSVIPHAINPVLRFSNRNEDYAKYRPKYPTAAIDKILEGLNGSPLLVADIGAGTGIASHQLAERDVHVLAIEPDAAMRQVATSHSRLEFREGTAEVTNLPDASVDLVTCFQSFHWFNLTQSLREFHRILKPSGRLALVWNYQDTSDKFTASYMRLIYQAAFSNPLQRFAANRLPSNFFRHWNVWLPLFFHRLPNFTNVRYYKFAHRHQLDLAGLIGLAMSKSFVPLDGAAHQQLIINLEELYETQPEESSIELVYYTNTYLAEPK